jgi:poly-gamma-glutamate synthesis protein (capsule biosynthesis protein)
LVFAGGIVLVGLIVLAIVTIHSDSGSGSGSGSGSTSRGGSSDTTSSSSQSAVIDTSFPKHSPLNPDWKGDGRAVTLGFGGDVHFAGAVGNSLSQNPATALGTTIPELFAGTQLRMVNLETVLTTTASPCPEPQPKQFLFNAPPSAVTALQSATISLVTEANDHALDCGQQGLAENLAIAHQTGYPIIGIGNDAAQAFAPYRVTINGQRIAIISATQNIQGNLAATWTATATQPGVASAIDPTELVREVQQIRPTVDTLIVYLHWGNETQSCPNSQQEPLAKQLVRAGADIVLGAETHVLSGGGYLGRSYVSYGLGNFAFYDNTPPETSSGSLILTAVGRQVTGATFRPATIVNGLPQPLTGAPAEAAVQSWAASRSCTDLAAKPAASLATMSAETRPFVAPTTTTTTPQPAPAHTTTTSRGAATTTSRPSTSHRAKTTSPTDNAG